jgi:hypothetical protein
LLCDKANNNGLQFTFETWFMQSMDVCMNECDVE